MGSEGKKKKGKDKWMKVEDMADEINEKDSVEDW